MAQQADGDGVFGYVRDQMLLENPDDVVAPMLRSPGLEAGGSFYAFASGADLIVKLPAAQVAELIAAGSGSACSPRPGRPMREWVQIPLVDAGACLELVRQARAFVVQLPQRPQRRRTSPPGG